MYVGRVRLRRPTLIGYCVSAEVELCQLQARIQDTTSEEVISYTVTDQSINQSINKPINKPINKLTD